VKAVKTPHGPRGLHQSPHGKYGWLKNGNPPGDLAAVPRCGARTRRGTACQAPAMRNGRCRLHGGLSTGPKTAAGIERIRAAVTKSGAYTAQAKAERAALRRLIQDSRRMLADLEKLGLEP
jgi:hypothetical protein